MRKILIFLLVTSFVLNLNCVSFAQNDGTLECSNITFTDGLGNAVTALVLEPVNAKVTVFNGTKSEAKPTLVVCSYQNNKLNGLWYKASDDVITAGNSADVYVNFTPVTADENTVIEATVVDSIIKLNAPIASARMLKSSTALEGIIVGGNRISEYSDEVNDYLFKVTGNDAKVVAQAADGGTKVEIIQPEALPDTSTINITAADGTERNINVTVYNNEEQLYSLTKLCYEVNGVKKRWQNFFTQNFRIKVYIF